MRIVSLVPSATEIVYALGLGDHLVGRTHRCDFPKDALSVPVVTLDVEPGTPERRLDSRLMTELEPDLVLTDGDDEDGLVGGLYGVSLGGAFFGESMFSKKTDASKVALVALVERLRELDCELLDTQWMTPHLRQFGGYEIPREEYLDRLQKAMEEDFTQPKPRVRL